jgi:hypothetical protein
VSRTRSAMTAVCWPFDLLKSAAQLDKGSMVLLRGLE